jgi:hypothetical protein
MPIPPKIETDSVTGPPAGAVADATTDPGDDARGADDERPAEEAAPADGLQPVTASAVTRPEITAVVLRRRLCRTMSDPLLDRPPGTGSRTGQKTAALHGRARAGAGCSPARLQPPATLPPGM